MLIRRSVFDAVGPFDTYLAHRSEEDWFMRAAALSIEKEVLPEVFILRRIHNDNRSHNRPKVDQAELLQLAQSSLARQGQRV
ncbi:MAG: hypothetical protein LJE91_00075 [Gammaproteobacteria bacterium]|nr:hypothetical protein [Gammaproteobacteria bacterium]